MSTILTYIKHIDGKSGTEPRTMADAEVEALAGRCAVFRFDPKPT
jgi:hypothetical protein